jgi:hypothetical protein
VTSPPRIIRVVCPACGTTFEGRGMALDHFVDELVGTAEDHADQLPLGPEEELLTDEAKLARRAEILAERMLGPAIREHVEDLFREREAEAS